MRILMQNFDSHKKKFSNTSPDIRINLPGPLKSLNIPGKVLDGELIITR